MADDRPEMPKETEAQRRKRELQAAALRENLRRRKAAQRDRDQDA